MTDNAAPATPDAIDTPNEQSAAPGDAPDRPDGLPEKFWDPATGGVRVDALAKSYVELERRLGERPVSSAPETPDGYEIVPPEGFESLLASDTEINSRLHAAGFSNEQAALVYELAAERLLPMVESLATDMGHAHETAEIVRRVGGEDRWRTLKPQIEAWGKAKLSPAAFDALSATADGVLAMRQMMRSGEPDVMRGGSGPAPMLSETELKQMMQDPRYWRDEDPAYVARVQAGFEALYPN